MPHLKTKQSELYYKIIGQGDPIIFLSGLAASHQNWSMQFYSLKKYFQILAVDNRGVGKSNGAIYNLTIDEMVDDINDLLSDLDIKSINFVGHSMGSMIAFEYALKYPKRVASLTLTSLPLNQYSEQQNDPTRQLQLLLDSGDNEHFSEKLTSYLFSKHFQNSKKFEALNGLISNNKGIYRHDVIGAQLRAVNEWKRAKRWENRPNNVACMLVYGSEDRFASVSQDFLSKHFSYASLKIFNNTGHAVHIEKAKEYNETIYNFIKTIQT